MKNKEMKDERVLALRQKINSDAYAILMIVLLGSILVQQFILDAPFEQYAVECLCFYGISIYILIRYFTLGLNVFGDEKRAKFISLVTCIVIGTTITVVNALSHYKAYQSQVDGMSSFVAMLAITFVSGTGITFVIMLFFNYLNKKKQEKIQNQLDKEE